MTEWHYAWGGEQRGPVAEADIATLIQQGIIKADSRVWRTGMTGWEAADRHFDFGPDRSGQSIASPPPLPPAPQTGAGQLASPAPPRRFFEAVAVCFRKYITFSGRASRSEFWYFTLFSLSANFIVGFAFGMARVLKSNFEHPFGFLAVIVTLFFLLPGLAVSFHRLHDTDCSGWWAGAGPLIGGFLGGIEGGLRAPAAHDPQLLTVVTVVSAIHFSGMLVYFVVLVVQMCRPGTPGPNRFG